MNEILIESNNVNNLEWEKSIIIYLKKEKKNT